MVQCYLMLFCYFLQQRPKVFLTLDELAQDDPVQTDINKLKVPPPLFMADVQHLLLYALQGQQASIKPRYVNCFKVWYFILT